MDTLKLIKTHFPEVGAKERKQFVKPLELQAKVEGKSLIDVIKEQRERFMKGKEQALPLLLHKIIATALLIETNDELEGTALHNYYCKITNGIGKRFMNAQIKLYQNEFNALAKDQGDNSNYMLNQLDAVTKITANAIKHDQDDVIAVCGLMQEDEVFAKRVQGIYKQHLKQIA